MSDAAERAAPAPPRGGWASAAERAWALLRRIGVGAREPSNWVQLFKFGVVGASGYVVNLAVFAILVEGFEANHIAGAVAAFLVAVTNNFVWNRHWTFDAAGGHAGEQAWRFLAVSLGGLAVNLAVLVLLVDAVELPEVPSQALAVAVAMPANFLGNRLWTFGLTARSAPRP